MPTTKVQHVEMKYPSKVSQFVSMTRGRLPLVISAPHGGSLSPDWIPSLTSGHSIADKNTLELTQELVKCIGKEMGGREPFAVYNKLHRRKMDANREPTQGTEGGLYATAVHQLYHDTLQQCLDEAKQYTSTNTKQVLLIDIHGYAPPKSWNTTKWDSSWIMVGHLVSRKNLRAIKNLPNEDWVRGPASLGTLLHSEGLLSEPSMQRPVPHAGKYFSGGYITSRYRHLTDNDMTTTVQTIQLELPRPMRNELGKVAHRMAKAIAKLLMEWKIVDKEVQQSEEEAIGEMVIVSSDDFDEGETDGCDEDDCNDGDEADDDVVGDFLGESSHEGYPRPNLIVVPSAPHSML